MNQIYPFKEKRVCERFPILLKAMVSVDSELIECVIFDISSGGSKVQLKGTEVHLEGDQVKFIVLNIPGFGDFEGEIVWTDDEYIGIKFHDDHKTVAKLINESTDRKAS